VLCKENGEIVDHLMLHCPFLKEIWDLIFSLFGLHWVMPRKVLDLLACWQGSFGKHRNIEIWRCIPHCVRWCILRERNHRSFDGCEQSVSTLKQFVLKTLFEWVFASGCFSCLNFIEFIDLCSLQA
jgi:hypothetical protein